MYQIEDREMIGDAQGDIGALGEAILNNDTETIKTIALKNKAKSVATKKTVVTMKEDLNKNWFMRLFTGTVKFIIENGGGLSEAGTNLITGNWGKVLMGLGLGALEWMRRQEKNRKQEFATAVNEIAHEPDEVKRKEISKNVFVKKKKVKEII